MSKEHPIIFSGPMVRAILDGRKTQTRRVMREQPDSGSCNPRFEDDGWRFTRDWHGVVTIGEVGPFKSPYGVPGDRLWVRESFRNGSCGIEYRADDVDPKLLKWRPSIHMPRGVSRITLKVLDVRVQMLREITEEDAKVEGAKSRAGFATLWDSIYARRTTAGGGCSWDDNPWVWAVTFLVEKEKDDN